ncbi:MAG TPA: hypothetical protein VGL77_13575 [Armatimonadota bacterium]|jgi:hypothetical protein
MRLTSDTIALGRLEQPFTLSIAQYDAPLEIAWQAGVLQITYRGQLPLRITGSAPTACAVLCNEQRSASDADGAIAVLVGCSTMVPAQDTTASYLHWWLAPPGDAAVTAEILTALRHDDWHVRLIAAAACEVRRESAAREVLLALLHEEEQAPLYENSQPHNWFVCGGVDEFAGDWAPLRRAEDPARFDAWSRRWRLQGQVARALGHIGGAGVEDAVLASLTDEQDFHYYVCICHALEACGTRAAIPTLTRLAQYPEACTNIAAARALTVVTARCLERESRDAQRCVENPWPAAASLSRGR